MAELYRMKQLMANRVLQPIIGGNAAIGQANDNSVRYHDEPAAGNMTAYVAFRTKIDDAIRNYRFILLPGVSIQSNAKLKRDGIRTPARRRCDVPPASLSELGRPRPSHRG